MAKFYAGGFLYNPEEHSVLLQLSDANAPTHPNQWSFFGGSNEGNEQPKETFIRELKEELGLDILENQIMPLLNYLSADHGAGRYIFYIETKVEKSKMVLAEGADFDWISLKKVFNYDLTDKVRNDLRDFIKTKNISIF